MLAVEMPDGSPHGATVHFAYAPDSSVFYFLTTPTYRKAEALYTRKISRASVVVGVDEGDLRTMQLDGEVAILQLDERPKFDEVYFGKFPDKVGKFYDDLAFKFTPTWWRFTDWTGVDGKRIISSEDGPV